MVAVDERPAAAEAACVAFVAAARAAPAPGGLMVAAAREDDDDSALIARSLSEPECFAVIFERHFDEIHRYLRRRLPGAAEELAAEVFTVAFDQRQRYRALGRSARPWLYGIASNLLFKRRRSEARALRALARSGARDATHDDEAYLEAENRVDARARTARLSAALAAMRAHDRNALLLYALSDFTYEEVASALGVPVGTVRSRIARARRHGEPLLRGTGDGDAC